jgi:hypothetical protein
VITWTLTSGNRTYSGAGTDGQEALAQALDAILGLYDLHTARGATGALAVCTVQMDNREPIVIRDIPALDVEDARRGLAVHLTQALTDLTGNPFAVLPSLALGDTV